MKLTSPPDTDCLPRISALRFDNDGYSLADELRRAILTGLSRYRKAIKIPFENEILAKTDGLGASCVCG